MQWETPSCHAAFFLARWMIKAPSFFMVELRTSREMGWSSLSLKKRQSLLMDRVFLNG